LPAPFHDPSKFTAPSRCRPAPRSGIVTVNWTKVHEKARAVLDATGDGCALRGAPAGGRRGRGCGAQRAALRLARLQLGPLTDTHAHTHACRPPTPPTPVPPARRLDVDEYKRAVKNGLVMLSQVRRPALGYGAAARRPLAGPWRTPSLPAPTPHAPPCTAPPPRAAPPQGLPSTSGFLMGFVIGMRMF
jgi:hypothetical protein